MGLSLKRKRKKNNLHDKTNGNPPIFAGFAKIQTLIWRYFNIKIYEEPKINGNIAIGQ